MRKNVVCGEFPEFCYRAFDCERYAQQFVASGILRLGCLHYYRNIEDSSRRDPTEGSACTREPGIVMEGCFSPNSEEKPIWTRRRGHQTHHSSLDGVFCFCTSLPTVDLNHMRGAFGEYIVRINDPRELADDINDYLASSGQQFVVKGCNVVYNKGQNLDRELTCDERADLSYSQKSEGFYADCEFRIVAIRCTPCKQECKYLDGQFGRAEPGCDELVAINLGKPLRYAQLCGY